MCGIAGGVTPEYFERQRLEDALDSIRHRGPDEAGIFLEGEAFLGIRRLAIIDTAGGSQPIFNEDGSIAVVLNGEIYNYVELASELKSLGHIFTTHSDTEVLVHAYEQWGEEMTGRLRGMFAFALWNKRTRSLFLGRDRFGKKPLYYCLPPGGGIFFASEIKALRFLAGEHSASWSTRPESIYDYLSLSIILQPNTVFKEVQMLPPASIGVFAEDRLKVREYWSLSYRTQTNLSYPDACKTLREAVSESVRLRLRSDVPLGVFLSGGIDSSIVAYEAAKQLGGSLQTFTVAVDDTELNEAPIAERTAKALGIQNTIIHLQIHPSELLQRLVPHFDQPFADPSTIPSFAVASKAREFVTVVLNGDGGDELFGGYRRYVGARLCDRFPWLRLAVQAKANKLLGLLSERRRNLVRFLDRLLRGAGSPPGRRYLTWTTDLLFDSEKRACWRDGIVRSTESSIENLLSPGMSQLRTQMDADVRILLLSALLVKMDMATMLASVEARSPLLDHKVAELAVSFPDEFLVRGIRTKAILRDAYRGLLSDEVLSGKKRGFEIPLERWMAVDLRPMLNDLLGAPNARLGEFVDLRYVKDLLNGKHCRGRRRAELLYSLLVLEIWLRSLAHAPSARPAYAIR